MKLKQIRIVLIVFIAFCSISYGQTNGQDKSIFNPELLDLGDGKINSSMLNASGDYVFQEFEVEVKQAGKYYLAAWVNGGMDINGEKLEYGVLVNSEKEEHKIRAEKDHPHAVDFGEQMFDLVSGVNKIAFKTRKPFCPNVEFIKVSQDEQNRQISSERYDQYIDEISTHKKAALADAMAGSGLKSTSDPLINYKVQMDVNFKYSYYTTLLLNDDETYTFETTDATGDTDPVIHLINTHNPSVSWTDDNGAPPPDNVNAKLTVDTEWYAGYYYLFIRKADTSDGTCNLKMDGTTIASNCAVSGSRIECTKTISDTYNWLTADLTGDSHIWLEDQTGSPGEIIANNNNWTASSLFTWGNNSRIRKNASTNVRALIVSSHSSSNPTGTCDLYMNVQDAPLFGKDWMLSSSAERSQYNCWSWAGGRMDLMIPDDNDFDPWYEGTNFLGALDNFYGNVDSDGDPLPRYSGAPTYIKDTTLDTINAVIVLFGDHATVRKPGNNQPHGYAWESKDGETNGRYMHPTLGGWGWGNPVDSYQEEATKKSTISENLSYEESIERGLTVLDVVTFSSDDKLRISDLKSNIPESEITDFNQLYNILESHYRDFSYSGYLDVKSSKEYKETYNFVTAKNENLWSLFYQKVSDRDGLAINLLSDCSKDKYQYIIDEVMEECGKARYTEDGAYIAPSPHANAMRYIKRLLDKGVKQTEGYSTIEDNSLVKNSFFCNVYPNPTAKVLNIDISVPEETTILISIYDMSGRKVLSLSENISTTGTIRTRLENIQSGFYLCEVIAGENISREQICVQH